MKDSHKLGKALNAWAEIFMHKSISGFVCFGKEHGLSMSQIGAMFQLSHGRLSGISHIGDNLGVTSAAASQMLEGLVRQGLIVRSEDPKDRRAKQIKLTDRGRQFIHAAMKHRHRWFKSISDELSPEERETVLAGLTILIEKIGKLGPNIQPFYERAETKENKKQ